MGQQRIARPCGSYLTTQIKIARGQSPLDPRTPARAGVQPLGARYGIRHEDVQGKRIGILMSAESLGDSIQCLAAKAWTPARAGVQPLGARYGIRYEDLCGKRIGIKKIAESLGDSIQCLAAKAWTPARAGVQPLGSWYGIRHEDVQGNHNQPNISSTLWRAVADHKNRAYYFEDTASPSIVWVDLTRVDFAEGTGRRKLELQGSSVLGGDQTKGFEAAEPFVFVAPK